MFAARTKPETRCALPLMVGGLSRASFSCLVGGSDAIVAAREYPTTRRNPPLPINRDGLVDCFCSCCSAGDETSEDERPADDEDSADLNRGLTACGTRGIDPPPATANKVVVDPAFLVDTGRAHTPNFEPSSDEPWTSDSGSFAGNVSLIVLCIDGKGETGTSLDSAVATDSALTFHILSCLLFGINCLEAATRAARRRSANSRRLARECELELESLLPLILSSLSAPECLLLPLNTLLALFALRAL